MKFQPQDKYNPIDVNPEPGNYYVSVVDGDQFGLLLGPFANHADALARVDDCREKAHEVNSKSVFYGFGTCKTGGDYTLPGLFNKLGLLQV